MFLLLLHNSATPDEANELSRGPFEQFLMLLCNFKSWDCKLRQNQIAIFNLASLTAQKKSFKNI